VHKRHHPDDREGIAVLQQRLEDARVKDAVDALVAKSPRMSESQRSLIASAFGTIMRT